MAKMKNKEETFVHCSAVSWQPFRSMLMTMCLLFTIYTQGGRPCSPHSFGQEPTQLRHMLTKHHNSHSIIKHSSNASRCSLFRDIVLFLYCICHMQPLSTVFFMITSSVLVCTHLFFLALACRLILSLPYFSAFRNLFNSTNFSIFAVTIP